MKTVDIKRKFLQFFVSKGHEKVKSSRLVPDGDATLLFTNSGMVQFKEVFLGAERRPYKTAVTAQQCLRAGGKHNDLENVGYTARHHTFFEMLGNFSFGDYFKEKAIPYAWEFLTDKEKGLGLEKEHLWMTVFGGGKLFGDDSPAVPADDEAYKIWLDTLMAAGFDEAEARRRITRISTADNFWMMGDTGPCGPCSEIFYDRDKTAAEFRGEDEKHADECVEIWNLVFMQYVRNPVLAEAGKSGVLNPLPKPCVDTGMGLERIAAVLQGVKSNYENDVFKDLLAEVNRAVVDAGGKDFGKKHSPPLCYSPSHCVIADHIRAVTRLILEDVLPSNEGLVFGGGVQPSNEGLVFGGGVQPSNEGRGYVLRRIMRRAMGHGHKMGASKPFLHKLSVKAILASIPEMSEQKNRQLQGFVDIRINPIILAEEKQFGKTLDLGIRELDKCIAIQFNSDEKTARIHRRGLYETSHGWVGDGSHEKTKQLGASIAQAEKSGEKFSGAAAFKLYDTYGFPVDMTADQIYPFGLTVDMDEFNRCMLEQRERSRAATKFKVGQKTIIYDGAATDFIGYDNDEKDAEILALFVDGELVNEAPPGSKPIIVLNRTPFYAESGGQIGDVGEFSHKGGAIAVCDTQKIRNDVWGHFAAPLKSTLKVGDEMRAAINKKHRRDCARSHSAAHLMHAALRQVLGKHVQQRGSQVSPGHIRFDFSHHGAASTEELAKVEGIVCAQIAANDEVQTDNMPFDDALKTGALALFGEKYGDIVRVVTIDKNFSVELCGGTHVNRAGDIGFFQFTGEQAIAAGIRRVEARTADFAVKFAQENVAQLRAAAELLKSPPDKISDKIGQLQLSLKESQKQLAAMKEGALSAQINLLAAKVNTVAGVKILIEKIPNADGKTLRDMALQLRARLPLTALFLAGDGGGKAAFVAAVDKNMPLNAREWLLAAVAASGAKGGGKDDFAQAGGGDVSAIDAVLTTAESMVKSH